MHWQCKSILSDGHTRTIRFIAWSHDGRYLASTSFDSTIVIWSKKTSGNVDSELKEDKSCADDWKLMFSLEGHENEVKAAAWSYDDLYMSTCSRDKSVWIWEKIETGTAITDEDENNFDFNNEEPIFECASVQTEHTQDVKRVLWHPCLPILVSASFDNQIKLYVQDDEDWHSFANLNEHESTVWAIDFNHNGTRLVSVSADETIKIWQPESSKLCQIETLLNTSLPLPKGSDKIYAELSKKWHIVASLSGYHHGTIYDCSWSIINNCILTVGADNSIHIFSELKNGEEKSDSSALVRYRQVAFQMEAHTEDINSVHWNPKHSDLFATGSDDSTIKIWNFTQTSL